MTLDPTEDAWLAGRAAHPAVAIDVAQLRAFVAGRALGEHLGDVYLACGLAHGDPAALATFEHTTLPAVARGLGRLASSPDARRELLQALRERMLVGKDGKRGIAGYDGRAPLAIWLRVCAARLGLRSAERERRVVDLGDEQLAQLAPGVPDPELAYLRAHYGDRFRAAFAAAVGELAPRERNLMRHAVIDGLGIDQIAAIYHVHRATAARQLERARRQLIERTREHMRQALGVSETELDSILRVLMSMADVTLRHVLARRPAQKSE
ncbi:MAG TPA: sigma factor-like helix-turn-helix DNA-binding protein [Kofleriaceae bacterium]|nr:sigma factor-like helix-turn-helix DNA-binding protein [Kofleriaceae bacterium]